jgi:hypothetical protein
VLPVSPLVSAHAYAKSKGIDATTMRLALKRVGIVGRFDPELADTLLDGAKAARYKNGEPGKEDSYAEADRRQKWAKARQEELKLQRVEGVLVLRSAVKKEEFDMGRRIRDKMENLPARLSGVLAAESDQARIFAYLTEEIHQALEEIAS